jgi:hypothetical protein
MFKLFNGVSYYFGTDDKVIHALQKAVDTGEIVRIWLGDPESGKAWTDTIGCVGTVLVSLPDRAGNRQPTLVAPGLEGGPTIMSQNVVRISTKGGDLYRHESFDTGHVSYQYEKDSNLPHVVTIDGVFQDRFKTIVAAMRLIVFLEGKVFYPDEFSEWPLSGYS